MDKFIINGGQALSGSIPVGGAKNASLALMPATILASGVSQLHNTPELRDIITMSRLLESMGLKVASKNHTITIDS